MMHVWLFNGQIHERNPLGTQVYRNEKLDPQRNINTVGILLATVHIGSGSQL